MAGDQSPVPSAWRDPRRCTPSCRAEDPAPGPGQASAESRAGAMPTLQGPVPAPGPLHLGHHRPPAAISSSFYPTLSPHRAGRATGQLRATQRSCGTEQRFGKKHSRRRSHRTGSVLRKVQLPVILAMLGPSEISHKINLYLSVSIKNDKWQLWM